MLRSLKDLESYEIGAIDGAIGHVKDPYLDDHTWVVRYLVVDSGSWLSSREVLISPMSIEYPNWAARLLPVSITKEQVRNSPGIDTGKPVSRQNDIRYLGYYGYPAYWGGAGLWGGGDDPGMLASGIGYGDSDNRDRLERERRSANAWHAGRRRSEAHQLRSCQALIGYHIHATDGEIGYVQDMLVDEETWSIRYVVVNTSNWWLGHQVLIAPQWIMQIRWADGTVEIDLSRESVKGAPPYDSTVMLNRRGETSLYAHYARPGCWTGNAVHDGGVPV
jgi:sporulation protein YlmC with PRC-barrel domain